MVVADGILIVHVEALDSASLDSLIVVIFCLKGGSIVEWPGYNIDCANVFQGNINHFLDGSLLDSLLVEMRAPLTINLIIFLHEPKMKL